MLIITAIAAAIGAVTRPVELGVMRVHLIGARPQEIEAIKTLETQPYRGVHIEISDTLAVIRFRGMPFFYTKDEVNEKILDGFRKVKRLHTVCRVDYGRENGSWLLFPISPNLLKWTHTRPADSFAGQPASYRSRSR